MKEPPSAQRRQIRLQCHDETGAEAMSRRAQWQAGGAVLKIKVGHAKTQRTGTGDKPVPPPGYGPFTTD